MRFKKIKIENYKGIKSLILDFDKPPKSKVFTLVGLNESGKTSILEAVSLLSKVIQEDKRHELIPKSKKINFNDTVRITGTIHVDEEDNKSILTYAKSLGLNDVEPFNEFSIISFYKFENSTPKNGSRYLKIEFSVKRKNSKKYKTLATTDTEYKQLKDFIDSKLVPKILFYPNFLQEFPNQIVIGDSEGIVDKSFYTDIVQDILHSLDASLNIEEHLLSRLIKDKYSDREALDSTLSHMSTIVTNKVFESWGRLFKVGTKEIVITAGNRLGNTTSKPEYFLEFKLKEGSDKFNISERSLGFKWFFTFLLFTEFRKNRASETGEILFLLDEPASNLHSTAQKNLIETFKEITTKSTLIYTTHSHHLINPNWLNGAYIVRNKAINYQDEFNFNSTHTDVEAIPYKQFISNYPNDKDYFQPILDTLDYQPGLLEKIPNIIITEGKNDYYALKIMDSIINKKQMLKNIYPGTGADKLYDIISIYLAWNKPFIILLDSDKKGEKAKKDYLKMYGNEIDNRIFTLLDINQNWKNVSLEFLFSEQDRVRLTKLFDPNELAFNKSKFNSALQDLAFISDSKIDVDNESKENFKLLITFLNDKISSITS